MSENLEKCELQGWNFIKLFVQISWNVNSIIFVYIYFALTAGRYSFIYFYMNLSLCLGELPFNPGHLFLSMHLTNRKCHFVADLHTTSLILACL